MAIVADKVEVVAIVGRVSELEMYAMRGVEAIAVLAEVEGCTRVVEANGRFQRSVGALARVNQLDFVECLVKEEDRAR